MSTQQKPKCVDLFSGTGGLGLSLRDFVTTIQYCEMNPYCQQVLAERMEDGRLDKASVHGDVRTLHVSPAVAPDMICGGFPCQDISSIGLQRGIAEGEQSGLFFQMMRIADECPSVRVMFFENVGNIVKCGMRDVLEQCVARGFDLQWTMRSAGAMGAPHVRQRWFCLAVKRGGHPSLSSLEGLRHDKDVSWWEKEPCPRAIVRPSRVGVTGEGGGEEKGIGTGERYDPNWIQRCQCLGNAVVPSVARAAFVELVAAHKNWSNLAVCLEDYGVDVKSLEYPYPEAGLVVDGRCFGIPKRKTVEVKHTIEITLAMAPKPVRVGNYPTPRRGITHPSALSERSIRDLPTVLVNCEETRRHMAEAHGVFPPEGTAGMHAVALPSVRYIEWMMGYPPDWTKVAAAAAKKAVSPSPSPSPPLNAQDAVVYIDDVEDNETHNAPLAAACQKCGKGGGGGGGGGRHHLNGMHMLMREHVGKGVTVVADIWRSLTDEQRAGYTAAARKSAAVYTSVQHLPNVA